MPLQVDRKLCRLFCYVFVINKYIVLLKWGGVCKPNKLPVKDSSIKLKKCQTNRESSTLALSAKKECFSFSKKSISI